MEDTMRISWKGYLVATVMGAGTGAGLAAATKGGYLANILVLGLAAPAILAAADAADGAMGKKVPAGDKTDK